MAPHGGSSGWLLRVAPQAGSGPVIVANPNMIACPPPWGEGEGGPARAPEESLGGPVSPRLCTIQAIRNFLNTH